MCAGAWQPGLIFSLWRVSRTGKKVEAHVASLVDHTETTLYTRGISMQNYQGAQQYYESVDCCHAVLRMRACIVAVLLRP
jgi:hypothetical protein